MHPWGKTLNKPVLLICVFLLAGTASADPCPTDTLPTYIGLGTGGCSIGPVQFSGFVSLPIPGFATQIQPADVQVVPINIGLNPGLEFQVNTSAGPGEFLDIVIGYLVSGPLLSQGMLSMTGAAATGDGAVTVIEDFCLGGTFDPDGPTGCTGTTNNLILFAIEGDSLTTDQLLFAPVSQINVIKDIGVDGGLLGTATLASASNQYTIIPEPGTLALVGSGLAAAGLLRRRGRRC